MTTPSPARARLLTAALLGLLAAACGTAPAGQNAGAVPPSATPDPGGELKDVQESLSPQPPPLGPAPCAEASGLRVSPGPVDAAMGLRTMTVYLTNCGTDSRTVEGHPALTVLDAEQQALDIKVQHGSEPIARLADFDDPPRPVTLAPEESAMAGLVWRNTVDDLTLTPLIGAYLDIAPAPGEPGELVRPHGGIDIGTTGRLGISAWKPYTPPGP